MHGKSFMSAPEDIKQRQLPYMPSPITDGDILGLPYSVMKWIQNFCDGKLEFEHYGDIQLTYTNIVRSLATTKVNDTLVLRTAGYYLSLAATSFVSYVELQNAARK
jgi:hypothetical protein